MLATEPLDLLYSIMCRLFTHLFTMDEVVRLYRPANPLFAECLFWRYSIRPTTTIYAVIKPHGDRVVQRCRWGMIPAWWPKPLAKFDLATAAAPIETVTEKPMFRSAFEKNRCIIPASGFYEWKTSGGRSRPYYFTARRHSILSIAGIWDEWINRDDGTKLLSCTMLTTRTNKFMRDYPDMPVLLAPEQIEGWLTGTIGKEGLGSAHEDLLQTWPVSQRINSLHVEDNDDSLIRRISAGSSANNSEKTARNIRREIRRKQSLERLVYGPQKTA
jgi:putative SOS response-associated peptidase YedK